MEPNKRRCPEAFDLPYPKKPKIYDDVFSNKVLTFHLSEQAFKPKFTNQVINQDEIITGYFNLSIDIQLTPLTLRPFVTISFQSKEEEAEDISQLLRQYYTSSQCTFVNTQFDVWCLEDKHFTFESPKHSLSSKNKEFHLYKISSSSPDFGIINDSFQKILTFFIDGCSDIGSDPYWTYYVLLDATDKNTLGFATTYDFFHSIDKVRTRISQFLILPPYQKQGLGTLILDFIYQECLISNSCFEITVEDPSDDFLCMNNLYCIRMLINKGFFPEFKEDRKINSKNYEEFKLTRKRVCEIHRQSKLTKKQVLRSIDCDVS